MSVTNPIDQEEFFRNIKLTDDGRLLVDTTGGGGPTANYYVLESIYTPFNLTQFDSLGNNVGINKDITGLTTVTTPDRTGAIFRNSGNGNIIIGLTSTGGNPTLWKSDDQGLSFSSVGASSSTGCYHINYDGNIYLAIGGSTSIPYAYNSTDGTTWSTNGLPAIVFRQSVFNSTQWVCIGYGTSDLPYIFTSPDAIIWTSRTQPFTGNRKIFSIAYSDTLDIFVISGYAAALGNPFAHSTDGIAWTEDTVAGTLIGNVSTTIWDPINELFIAAGYTATTNYISLAYSSDGITWTKGTGYNTSFIGSTSHHFKIYVDTVNSKIVAYNTYNMFESSDGIAWTQINNRYTGIINEACKEAFFYVPM